MHQDKTPVFGYQSRSDFITENLGISMSAIVQTRNHKSAIYNYKIHCPMSALILYASSV